MTAIEGARLAPEQNPTSRPPSLGQASAVVGSATLAASLANYLLNLLLARWLSPGPFGDANLVVTLLLAVTAVAVTLQLVTARRIGIGEANGAAIRSQLLTRAWRVGVATGAIGIAISPLVRDATSSASAVPFVALAIGLPWYLAQAVERGVLQGTLRFSSLAMTLIVEAAVRLTFSLLLVAAGFGVTGATVGITLSFVATWLVARTAVGRSMDTSTPAASPITGLDDRIAAQAAAILLVGQIIVNNGDVLVAKMLFDPEPAGVYAVVALAGRGIFFLSWAVVTVAFPLAAGGQRKAIERQALRLVAAIGAVATAVVGLAAPYVTPVVFGPGYEAAADLFLPYALATAIFAVANVSASLAAARGERRAGVLLVVGGIGQAALLAAVATDLAALCWLQVVAMTVLLAAVLVERRTQASWRDGR